MRTITAVDIMDTTQEGTVTQSIQGTREHITDMLLTTREGITRRTTMRHIGLTMQEQRIDMQRIQGHITGYLIDTQGIIKEKRI